MTEQIICEDIEVENKKEYIYTDNTRIGSYSDDQTTSYIVSIANTFQHKKGIEITTQIIIHSIQTLVNETKKYLKEKNVENVSPVVFLLNIHRTNEIKNVCESLSLKEKFLMDAFLENVFEINFNRILKDVLIDLCLKEKIELKKIINFLDKEDQENINLLLTSK